MSFGAPSVINRFYYQIEDGNQRREFLASFWWWLVLFNGGLTILLLVFGQGILEGLFSRLTFSPFGRLAVLAAYLQTAFTPVLLGLYRIREQPARYVVISGGQALALAAFNVWLVVMLHRGALGATEARTYSAALVSFIALVLLLKELGFSWNRHFIRQAIAFGTPLVPHRASHWALNASDRMVLDRFVSLSAIGLYSVAYRVSFVVAVVYQALDQAVLPSFSRAGKSADALRQIPRLATYNALVTITLGISAILVGDDLVKLLLPDSYARATYLMPWIILGMIFLGLYYIPLKSLTLIAGKTRIVPVATLIAGLANVGLNLLLVPKIGVIAAAVDTAIGYFVLAVLVTVLAQRIRHIPYEWSRFLRMVIGALAVTGISRLIVPPAVEAKLVVDLALLLCFPILLTVLGFWTERERRYLRSLLRHS
jgi:O-antigen/teichoic acid export membrane protein